MVARGAHLDAIRDNGITLRTEEGVLAATVQASDDPRDLGAQDVVIVTVKGPSLAGIVEPMQALLGPDTPIVFAMNGIPWWYFYGLDPRGRERRLPRLDPEGRWWDEIGPDRALGGVVYSANTVVEPGVVHNASVGNELRIGEPTGEATDRAGLIQGALASAGLAAPAPDIRQEIWTKLLGNIAYAPVACLTGSTTDQIKTDRELRKLAIEVMNEAIAIAKALGTPLDISAEERVSRRGSIGHKLSMLQDLEQGRPMEIDSILVVPQELARSTGVETPALDRMLALLKQRARLAGLYDG